MTLTAAITSMMEWQYLTLSVPVTILSMWYVRTFWTKDSKLPPGPPRVPFPFNVLLMKLFSERVLDGLQYIAKTYGDIVYMHFGSRPMVLISKIDVVKELITKQADITSGRNPPPVWGHVLRYDNGGIIFSQDDVWLENRRFALKALRSMGMGKRNLEHVINEEADALSELLIAKHQGATCIQPTMYKAVSNIICYISFGHRFEYDDVKLKNILHMIFRLANEDVGFIVSLPLIFYRSQLRNMEGIRDFINEEIDSHQSSFDENDMRDLVDMFIAEMDRLKAEGAVTYLRPEYFWTSIADLFLAGSETSTSTLMWAIHLMAAEPEIQAKLFNEIDKVVGLQRKPTYLDRENMPYTEAFLQEILRFRPVGPIGVAHVTTTDIHINGYEIPKGCELVMNIFGIHHDPTVWRDPEVFRPERFLSKDGKSVLKRPEFIPFGAGRRICLGEQLAKMESFLFLINLVQRFTFKLPDGATPCFDYAGSIQTMAPPQYPVVLFQR